MTSQLLSMEKNGLITPEFVSDLEKKAKNYNQDVISKLGYYKIQEKTQ
ncbi:MAG: hypothetical protein JW700_04070 [Candidatus Aenigmarchaeota archaeon]|nr:hypothetical protein [Candidatus Aenigmarchaeota archaeon]